DYSAGADCEENAPPGESCKIKHASQAFIFIAFFCTMCSAVLESWNLWSHHNRSREPVSSHTKETPREEPVVTGTAAA
ncbi:hypothetical protein LOY86_004862, partial [Ophidiomyces ophidiicola]